MDNENYFNDSNLLEEEKSPLFLGYMDDPFEEEDYNRKELAYWLATLEKEVKEIQDTSLQIKRYLSYLKK